MTNASSLSAKMGVWLEENQGHQYDFIFTDAWPGKFSHLDMTLARLSISCIYIIDDLLPQQNWPREHAPRVSLLMQALESRTNFISMGITWASGLMLVTRVN